MAGRRVKIMAIMKVEVPFGEADRIAGAIRDILYPAERIIEVQRDEKNSTIICGISCRKNMVGAGMVRAGAILSRLPEEDEKLVKLGAVQPE